MSAWARKTNQLGILDPVTKKPSWPWTYEARPGGHTYVLPPRVRDVLIEEVGDLPDHRSFITLWSKGQIALERSVLAPTKELTHTAGEQFRKVGVRPGDRVYVLGTDRGDLLLIGRLAVTDVLTDTEARERLGSSPIYEASDHLVGTGTQMVLDRRVPREIVRQLERFSGKPISKAGADGAVTSNGLRATGRITAASANLLDAVLPDTIAITVVEPPEEALSEGARRVAYATQVERSKIARDRALEIHGTDCMACGFSFGATYGEIGEGHAEIHHLVPVATAGLRTVDPREDLVVLCANCHRMAHRRDPPFSVADLQSRLRSRPAVQD
jgi:hypothetical protein